MKIQLKISDFTLIWYMEDKKILDVESERIRIN